MNGKPIGVVRASLGAMSTIADVDALLIFLIDTFVEQPEREIIVLQTSAPGGFNFDREARMRKDSGFASGNDNILPTSGYHPKHLPSSLTTMKPRLHLQESFYGHGNRLALEQMPPMPQISQKWLDKNKLARSVRDLRRATVVVAREEELNTADKREQDAGRKSNFSLRFWKSRKVGV